MVRVPYITPFFTPHSGVADANPIGKKSKSLIKRFGFAMQSYKILFINQRYTLHFNVI